MDSETGQDQAPVAQPVEAGRRRFLGHISRIAPAAILTLNSSAALAQARSSLTAAAGPSTLDYVEDFNGDMGRRERAAISADQQGYMLDGPMPTHPNPRNRDYPKPLCIVGESANGVGATLPGDRIDLSGGNYSIANFRIGKKGNDSGRCRAGVLVSVSSFASIDMRFTQV